MTSIQTTIPTAGHKLMHLNHDTAHMTDAQYRLYSFLVMYWQENGCYPSNATLARLLRWDVGKVKKIRDQLKEMGDISFESGGWVPGRGNVSTRYTINRAKKWWAEKVGGEGQSAPTGEGKTAVSGASDVGVNPPPEQEEDSSKIKTGQDRGTGATMRQAMRAAPADVAPLIAKLQQVPGKPGCLPERLIPKVLEAVERCGLTAVEDLYALLAPEKGQLPPWKLYQMLDGLEAHSDKEARPEPEPLPPDTPLIVEAKGLVEAAAPNIPARIRLEARLRAADVDFKVMWWKEDMHKLAQALARTLAAERGIR